MIISKSQAVGMALAAGVSVAWAEPPSLTLYGTIDTGFVATNHTGDGNQNTEGFADSILGVSNVGFKGSHDLGNGIQGFFNLQAGFNPSTGRQNQSDVLFSRNAYVGLQGSLGAYAAEMQWLPTITRSGTRTCGVNSVTSASVPAAIWSAKASIRRKPSDCAKDVIAPEPLPVG